MQILTKLAVALHLPMLLVITSSPAHAQGSGAAVRLNGVDARGSAPGVGNLLSNSTWEAWVRLPQYEALMTSPGIVLSRWGMWTSAAPWVVPANGRCMASAGYNNPGDGLAPGVALSAANWHHLATVYGPEPAPSYKFYVDGQLVQSVPAVGDTPSDGWETDLGCWGYIGYGGFLKADVDEARLSNIPRYTSTFTPPTQFVPDAGTVALWHFDEGAGNKAFDASGNGNHFTLHGGYSWVDGVGTSPYYYCTTKANSAGCFPEIGWSGEPRLGGPTDNFRVTASNLLNRKPGMMIWSLTPASVPFAGGVLCVGAPVIRTALQASGGSPAPQVDCSGSYSFHFSHAYAAQYLLTPGQTVRAQYWSRDPGYGTPNNAGLTNALGAVLLP
jgi:hypothetical protein